MKKMLPLMRREWLQHRFGWFLMATLPLVLGLLLTGLGSVQFSDDGVAVHAGDVLPAVLATVSIAATTCLVFGIAWISSLIIVTGLARRDHADRSIEFWLSLPAGHAESLASPMLVHLLIVPAVALLVGLGTGYAISAVLVARVAGFSGWLALPWGNIVPASLAILLRLLIGLPLATLWLLPLLLATVLMTAWFRKWGWVILAVGVGLGSLLLDRLFGQPLLSNAINGLFVQAAQALVQGGDSSFAINNPDDAITAVRAVPGWALTDAGRALRALMSPLMAGGLLFSAACFALLVQWRQRGAGAAG